MITMIDNKDWGWWISNNIMLYLLIHHDAKMRNFHLIFGQKSLIVSLIIVFSFIVLYDRYSDKHQNNILILF